MSSLAHISISRPQPSNRILATGLLRRLIAKIAFEFEVRRSLREIQGFDDKMLRDIGLQRGGIEHALRNGVAEAAMRTLQR